MGIKKEKLFFSVLFTIFIINFISAVPLVTTIQQFTTGYTIQIPQDNILKVGQSYSFRFHVFNISNGYPISNGVSCDFHLYNSTGDRIYVNVNSTPNGYNVFSFWVDGGNFSIPQRDYYFIHCNSSSLGGFGESILYVDPLGDEGSLFQSSLFIVFLLLFFSFFIGGLNGMFKTETLHWKIGFICLSYISLFSIFFLSWLFSSSYLWLTPIIASIFWILWLVMGFSFLPFIIIVSLIIINQGVQENLIKDYVSQGYNRHDAMELSKKRKR